MGFVNPYNFAREGMPAERRRPPDGDRLTGRHGVLTARLRALTPLFTPAYTARAPGGSPDLRFFQTDGRPAIPGPTLKGMLRSLAEAISNGCSPFQRSFERQCSLPDHLCPACRLFGFLAGGKVHSGQVNVSDARIVGDAERDWRLLPPVNLKELGTPKRSHTPFYEDQGDPRGRKFYYHQKDRTAQNIPSERTLSGRNSRIQPLFPGTFEFTIRFRNLPDDDLGLLVHALDLPEGMAHKVGMGKSLGLGSARVTVTGWREAGPAGNDPAARYRALAAPTAEEAAAGALADTLAQCKRTYAEAYAQHVHQAAGTDLWEVDQPNLHDLKLMLRWDLAYADKIRFPGWGWFQQDKQVGTRLPTAQEVEEGALLPDEPGGNW